LTQAFLFDGRAERFLMSVLMHSSGKVTFPAGTSEAGKSVHRTEFDCDEDHRQGGFRV
jgi:hypothetical protein